MRAAIAWMILATSACAQTVSTPLLQGPPGPPGPFACGVGDLDSTCHVTPSAAALSAIQATIPVPLGTVPPGATPTGLVGVPGTYTPGSASPPSLSRSTTVITASDGTFTVSWPAPLNTIVPVVNLIPINTGTQPAICNVTARAAASVAGKCWMLATSVVSVLGATINVASGNAGGMSVMIFAREPTQ